MRGRLVGSLLVLTVVLSPGLAFADRTNQASPLPKIRLVATGGTISNRSGGRLTADGLRINAATACDGTSSQCLPPVERRVS